MIEPGLWDMIMRLRSRGISDARVMEALERTPRSRFVSESFREQAFDPIELPLPCGQAMLTPLLSAQLLQLAGLRRDHKTLVVGLGSGWLAGLASRTSPRTYAVERYRDLLTLAESNFVRAGVAGVLTRWGDGRFGWAAQAPFDRIIVTAGLSAMPKACLTQLAESGRISAVLDGQLGTHDGTSFTPVLPATIPPIESGKSEAL